VLIAEDEVHQMRLIIKMLSNDPFEIIKAENGQIAYEKALAFLPDVIILDNNMPVMGGIEACKKIKATKELKEIPILFVTAQHDQNTFLEAFAAGAVDYITKPYSKEMLYARIVAQLKVREMHLEKIGLVNALHHSMNDKVFGQLAVGLAHNFNNMLTSVMGYCQLIEMSTKEDVNKTRIEKVRKVLVNVHKMITDLSEFADRSDTVRDKFNIKDFIKQKLEFFSNSHVGDLDYTLDCEIPDAELNLDVERESFSTSLFNIMQNCIEATSSERPLKINISIDKKKLPKKVVDRNNGSNMDDDFVCLRFQDTGLGFSEEIGDPIDAFQPFQTIKKTVGVGLGLSIVQGFIARHLGYTDAGSIFDEEGDPVGAYVELYIPFQ